MALCLVFLITSLAIVSPVANAQGIGISLRSHWLHERDASVMEFQEGDTAVLLCVGKETVQNRPFDTLEMHWLKPALHGEDDWVTIANRESIVYYDGRNRFSKPNLTINSQNETEYRMTISPIDRYDGGTPPRFGCEFGFNTSNFTARQRSEPEANVIWNPPSATCSSTILPGSSAKKGDDVSRYCSVTDVDRLSTGSVTVWNGEVNLAADQTKTPLTPGYEYNISYANTVTDDTANYVYMCRYSASGGFEEYEANCTFNRPLCVVDDLADPCPLSPPSSSTEPRRFMMSSVYMGLLVMVSSRII